MASRLKSRFRLPRRRSKYLHCGHCEEYLPRSTFWKHRRLFYNPSTSSWIPKQKVDSKSPQTATGEETSDPFRKIFESAESGGSSSFSEDSDGEPRFDVDWGTDTIGEIQSGDKPVKEKNNPDSMEEVFDSDMDEEVQSSNDDSSSSFSGTDDEAWHESLDEPPEGLFEEEVLPEPRQETTSLKTLQSLLHWFVYFILIWQTTCKISDNGLEWMLRFLSQFLSTVGQTYSCEFLIKMAVMFPSSLYLARKLIQFDRDDFTKYAVCPKCCTLYDLHSCTMYVGNKRVVRGCTAKRFKRGRAKECGEALARKVTFPSGKTQFYPLKLYCVSSIINQIESLLKKSGIPELCEAWRSRNVEEGKMFDIFDGKIWKNFMQYNGENFLNSPRNLAFGINVDWFQPYKHRKDRSVGVIYLVLLNLPRQERYKWENVIVAGIVPEMSKEPKSLNTFLDPIVEELKALWKGVRLETSTSKIPLLYRGALLFASADIPALRKLCGFKGHSAHRGCSKCFKFFPSSFKEKTNYSGFDREHWPSRDNVSHRRHAEEVRAACTKSKQEDLAKKYGVYYSSLLRLEYFDVIQLHAIDPMHNLFLGTAKYMFKLWVAKGLLSQQLLKKVEEKIKSLNVPTGYGRLPFKISSNYGSYTASQWKNWTLVYSMYALHDILPADHLKCWQTFVLACKYLINPILSNIDVVRADLLFVKFGKEVEHLYGEKNVTPNMHLHCHLKECISNFGPAHVFWCFSFERFNGILGTTHLNGVSIEVQIMRKLLASRFAWKVELANDLPHITLPFFDLKCSALEQSFNATAALSLFNSATCYGIEEFQSSNTGIVKLPSSFKHILLDTDDLKLLLSTYQVIYPQVPLFLSCLALTAKKYSTISLGGETFGSKLDCRNLRSARIMASWEGENGSIDLCGESRSGQINYYLLHSVNINGVRIQHVFACIWWNCADEDKCLYGNPVQVWKVSTSNRSGPSCFMPVQRIKQKLAFRVFDKNGEKKMVVCPIPRPFH